MRGTRVGAPSARSYRPSGCPWAWSACPRAAASQTSPSAIRRRPGESTARRAAAPSFDPERERALRHIGVDRQDAPEDLVRARRQRRQRRAQQRRVRAIHTAVTPVHLLATLVDDAQRAVGGLEALAEVQLDLVRRALQAAFEARLGALQYGMPDRAAGRGSDHGEREAGAPRARAPPGPQ